MKREEVLKSIGERLKKAREAKALNLEQAHIKTRIHLNVLKALEEGRIDEVLSVPYAKGFLKKYAVFLALNGDEILNEYLSLHSEPRAASPLQWSALSKPAAAGSLAKFYLYLTLFIIAAVLISASSAYLKNRRTRASQARPRVAVVKGQAPARVPLQSAKKQATAKTSLKDTAAFAIAIPKNEPILVTLRVRRNVLVQAAKDGNVMFRNVLRGGIQESMRAKDKINLAISNIESLDIIVNGKPLPIARKGEIRDLEITRNGFKIK